MHHKGGKKAYVKGDNTSKVRQSCLPSTVSPHQDMKRASLKREKEEGGSGERVGGGWLMHFMLSQLPKVILSIMY